MLKGKKKITPLPGTRTHSWDRCEPSCQCSSVVMCFGMLLWSVVLLWVVSCESFHGFIDRFVLCRKQKCFPCEFPFSRTRASLGEERLSTALSLPSSPHQKCHLFKAFSHLLITVVRCLNLMWKEHWASATRPYFQLQWLYKALRLA